MNQTERAEILKMIEQGQVSAEQAIDMLSAKPETADVPEPSAPMTDEAPDAPQAQAPMPEEKAPPQDLSPRRYVHIRISNPETGAKRVNVNLPLHWLKFGWKIGARLAPQLQDLDWEEMTHSLEQGQPISLVEVEGEERVEIYIE
jgi:hypothetical protein